MKIFKIITFGLVVVSLFTCTTVNKTELPDVVEIGEQIWTINNLNESTFRNGDVIPEARSNEEWIAAGRDRKPVWSYYGNDPGNGDRYGKLYNFYAVNDPRELAPEGFKIPSEADWRELASNLGGINSAGIKMKTEQGWVNDVTENKQGIFNALPSGNRNADGVFYFQGEYSFWWTSNSVGRTEVQWMARYAGLKYYSDEITLANSYQRNGLSVRLLKH